MTHPLSSSGALEEDLEEFPAPSCWNSTARPFWFWPVLSASGMHSQNSELTQDHWAPASHANITASRKPSLVLPSAPSSQGYLYITFPCMENPALCHALGTGKTVQKGLFNSMFLRHSTYLRAGRCLHPDPAGDRHLGSGSCSLSPSPGQALVPAGLPWLHAAKIVWPGLGGWSPTEILWHDLSACHPCTLDDCIIQRSRPQNPQHLRSPHAAVLSHHSCGSPASLLPLGSLLCSYLGLCTRTSLSAYTAPG